MGFIEQNWVPTPPRSDLTNDDSRFGTKLTFVTDRHAAHHHAAQLGSSSIVCSSGVLAARLTHAGVRLGRTPIG